MTKKIALANRSRKNRIFYDFLVRDIAINLNLGEKQLNRDLLAPVYANHSHAANLNDVNYCQVTRDSGCFYLPYNKILSKEMLDQLDAILAEAPPELHHCGSNKMITDYLRQRTDLTDCHFTALNIMQSIN